MKKHELQQLQLDDVFKAYQPLLSMARPNDGWVKTVRNALGMTQGQLAKRLGISRQAVHNLEISEAKQRISVESLNRLAEVMHCRLVYAIVPETGSIEGLLNRRANELAASILEKSGHSMNLEAQGVSDHENSRQREMLAEELLRDNPRNLWK